MEPVEFSGFAERRYPVDGFGCLHHGVTQFVHGDEPLVDESEHEFGVAAPADRIPVFVVFELVVDATFAEDVEDDGVDLVYGFAAERAETIDVDTAVVERGDNGQTVLAPEFEVFGTGAGCDVDDAGTFFFAYIFPFDDAVLVAGFGLCFEIVEGAAVAPSEEV